MIKKLINIGLVFALILYSTSCGNDFLDVNVDPNNPSDATVNLVFPAAVASSAGVIGGWYAVLGGIWSQHWAQNNGSNQYRDFDSYDLQPTDLDFQFQELYANALNDYEFVRKRASAEKNWTFYLMATVMQAYTYQVLADLYDQIPFSQALQGNQNNLTPVYENGQAVYDSLIVRLDEALAKDFNYSENGSLTSKAPGEADFLFGGNMVKWRQFANTLKLKMYLRQIYARPEVAKAGIQALYASSAQFLTEDAAMTQFIDVASKSNPLYEADQRQLNTNQNLRASVTLLSFLQASKDPRIDAYFIPGSAGHRGLAQGSFNIPSTSIVPTALSRALLTATDPVYFISASESYFLQAEAVARNLGTGNDEALYTQGIAASFAQNNMSTTIILDSQGNDSLSYSTVDSLISPEKPYAYPSTGSFKEKLKAITVQKWAAMAGTNQGLESFFEQNRTGFPESTDVAAFLPNNTVNPEYYPAHAGEFTYAVEGVTSGLFPKRALFTDTERSRNPNTPPQEPITKAIWWDVAEKID
ncbi:SusD/RagB family nutrient-binding outer membrane lipoprotein [Rhodocytophaga rosea]|uniref:SusD/RagB family nutrient-binding outer membrane lipoprotein n=1 Tax=Rhodocytophaga rosea TaxID=2704465 RepID=A0A6C0GDH9_9BACT|nr:SusD/RagB family nutrient-binding outer membrane lipoprotein [Rhodocytophaga rosea]QHT65988.1 SusD/RagB family nutrient-binding outer membrane lipoprotein [Rhodocytophaga rosea]